MNIEEKSCKVHDQCQYIKRNFKGNNMLVKLAQVTADEWLDMYAYRPFLKDFPMILKKYKLMTPDQRKKFNKDDPEWINNEEMKEYSDEKGQVRIKNTSNREYLKGSIGQSEYDDIKPIINFFNGKIVGVYERLE